MAILTSKEAEEIANKLEAEIKPGRRHPKVLVRWKGRIVAQYGIRRGSGDVSHNYISRQLFISFRETLDLARCPLTREQYFQILRLKGKLPST